MRTGQAGRGQVVNMYEHTRKGCGANRSRLPMQQCLFALAMPQCLLQEPCNDMAALCLVQAEHYDRTRQQQVDIGLLAPDEAEAQQPAAQVGCCTLHWRLASYSETGISRRQLHGEGFCLDAAHHARPCVC